MVKHHITLEHDRELGVKPPFSGIKPNNYIELVRHPSLTPILFPNHINPWILLSQATWWKVSSNSALRVAGYSSCRRSRLGSSNFAWQSGWVLGRPGGHMDVRKHILNLRKKFSMVTKCGNGKSSLNGSLKWQAMRDFSIATFDYPQVRKLSPIRFQSNIRSLYQPKTVVCSSSQRRLSNWTWKMWNPKCRHIHT